MIQQYQLERVAANYANHCRIVIIVAEILGFLPIVKF